VNFDEATVMLFKEVRNLTWLGFKVPVAIKHLAEEVRQALASPCHALRRCVDDDLHDGEALPSACTAMLMCVDMYGARECRRRSGTRTPWRCRRRCARWRRRRRA
jgi:hypothetical protein